MDRSEAHHRSCGGGAAILLVHPIGGKESDLKKIAAGVDQLGNALPRGQLAAFVLFLDARLAPAEFNGLGLRVQHAEHVLEIVFVLVKGEVFPDGGAGGWHAGLMRGDRYP